MILEVKNLNKSFRHPWKLQNIQVLRNVNFNIENQSIVGFLGANGSGKTTTIKCLLGLLKYQSGELKMFNTHHLHKQVKRDLGYLPERPFFYNYLTADEFLRFYGQINGLKAAELSGRIEELLELVGLTHAKKLYLKQFSKGMLQRIGLAQALIHRPKLLILDEPLSGLDPDGRRQLVKIIQNTFDNENTTIFFSSHLLDDIDRLCQNLVVIKKGQVHFNGPKTEFVNQETQTYLIRYRLENEMNSQKIESFDRLQNKIDQIRNKDGQIFSVEQERMSLDKAFKNFQLQETDK